MYRVVIGHYIVFTICIYHGNEVANGLAKLTSTTILPSFAQLPWTDFALILRCHTINL